MEWRLLSELLWLTSDPQVLELESIRRLALLRFFSSVFFS